MSGEQELEDVETLEALEELLSSLPGLLNE